MQIEARNGVFPAFVRMPYPKLWETYGDEPVGKYGRENTLPITESNVG